jgi:hypothetical protein
LRAPFLSALAIIAVAPIAIAQELPTRADDQLTPGAIASTDVAAVCGSDDRPGAAYRRAHRVWHDKAETLAKYGLPPSVTSLVEDDDRVPVCLGGDNADPRNHWPQPWAQAREKDRLETAICRMVCNGHAMTLEAAQAIFLGDWSMSYQRIFGRVPTP